MTKTTFIFAVNGKLFIKLVKLTHLQRRRCWAIHSNAADDDDEDWWSEAAIVAADVAVGDAGGAEQRYSTTL